MNTPTVPVTFTEIVVRYDSANKRTIYCALPDLPENPTRDEMLEAAEEQGFIEFSDLDFDCSAVEIEEEDYISAVEINSEE